MNSTIQRVGNLYNYVKHLRSQENYGDILRLKVWGKIL